MKRENQGRLRNRKKKKTTPSINDLCSRRNNQFGNKIFLLEYYVALVAWCLIKQRHFMAETPLMKSPKKKLHKNEFHDQKLKKRE